MKIGEDLRASVRTDADNVTALTYRHGTKYNTIMLTQGGVRNLVRALEDSAREPLTRFDVLWDRPTTFVSDTNVLTEGFTLPELREIAPPDPIPELTSMLPYGKPFPVGDQALWNACVTECAITHKDTMQRYADVRGITRTDAKNETFTLRYGSGGMQKMGRATRDAPKGVPNIVEDWSLTVKDKLKREDF